MSSWTVLNTDVNVEEQRRRRLLSCVSFREVDASGDSHDRHKKT